MTNKKISVLTTATTPLAGTEVLPIVQSSATVNVAVSNLTAGRTVNADTFIAGTDPSGLGKLRVGGDAWLGGTLKFASGDIGTSSGNSPANIYAGVTVVANNDPSGAGALRVGSPGAWIGGYLRFAADGANDIGQSSNGRPSNLYLTGNIIPGVAAKGINFTANTPAAGMTSQLLNWYEEGTWTPSTAWATFVGAASSSGTYTRVGRQVTINGTLTGATSVTVGATGILTTSLPFTASFDGIGSMAASTNTASGVARVTGPYVVAVTTMAPVTSITFTATYFV